MKLRADRSPGAVLAGTLLAAGLLLTAPAGAHAQLTGASPPPGKATGLGSVSGLAADTKPEALENVGFDQHLGASLPLELAFVDEAGRAVTLGDYFDGRPVLLVPVYYDCPMLCNLVMNSVATSIATTDLVPGRDFEVVAVSFDPEDTPELAAEKKRQTLIRYDRGDAEADAAGWHFLSGEPAAIQAFTEAIGFRYQKDETTGEFAHTAGFAVATPDGTIARYFFGLEYPGRHVQLALVEAAEERIGSLADQVFLYCFRYDPSSGQYTAMTLNLVRLAGLLTIVLLVVFVGLALRKERRGRMHRPNSPGIA